MGRQAGITHKGYLINSGEGSVMRGRKVGVITLAGLFALGWPVGLPPAMGQVPGPVKVTGKVVDAKGDPVEGATVASFWIRSSRQPDGNGGSSFNAFQGVTTDREGAFALELQLYGRDGALMAMDRGQRMGGSVVVKAKGPAEPLKITLGPLVRVHGSFSCNELKKRPPWTNVYITLMPGNVRLVQNDSREATFDVLVPPGTYQFWGYGSDVADLRKEITARADTTDLNLGILDMPATIIAKHKGKAPPQWNVTDARGAKKDVKLADFKGKWVLMEFWGFW
jgi:hypothetical protein